MVKTLRSLVLEVIPQELRIELDLLSRRRTIQNREKVDQILKLLRKYQIGDFTQLGSGTNRYAIRLQGFVLKIALDNDGKVDNLSEFSWSKFLYPHVPMVHEVTENGLLLVCEYVQPFMSMVEMQKHADKIREILKDLSVICLIGDVGIASVNYANWGVRPGAEEDPVCLDFAYIYEVRSKIFMCRNCTAGSVLIPDDDYNALYCPTCKAKVLFSELRSRISREEHLKEISDMDKKGYLLTESKVPTELQPSKSTWMLQHKKKKKKTQNQNPQIYEDTTQEEIKMTNRYDQMARSFDWGKYQSIVTSSEVVTTDDEPEILLPSVAFNEGDEEPAAPEIDRSMVDQVLAAYEANLQPSPQPVEKVIYEIPEPVMVEPPAEKPTRPPVAATEPVPAAEVKPITTEEKKELKAAVAPMKKGPTPREEAFTPHFMEHSYPCISKISQKIASDLEHTDFFQRIQVHLLEKKLFKGNFFERLQNSICYSLMEFAEFTSTMEEKDGRKRKVWNGPDSFVGKKCEPTMIFLGRYWNTREINGLEMSNEIIPRYREIFKDYQGLQMEWAALCVQNMSNRCRMDKVAKRLLLETLQERWCVETPVAEEPTPEPTPEPAVEELPAVQQANEAVEAAATQLNEDMKEAAAEEEETFQMSSVPASNGLAFSSGPVPQFTAPKVEEEDDDDEDEEMESVGESKALKVLIDSCNFDAFTIMTVHNYVGSGYADVPLYVDRNWRKAARTPAKSVYPGNGMWDWLTHFQPDIMAIANSEEDAKRMLAMNPTDELEEGLKLIHTVIGISQDQSKFYIGTYFISDFLELTKDDNGDGETDIVDDMDDILAIGNLLMHAMEDSPFSHRKWNLSCIPEEQFVSLSDLCGIAEFLKSAKDSEKEDDEEDDEDDEFDKEFAEIPGQPQDSLIAAAEAAMAAEAAPAKPSHVLNPIPRIREEDRKYRPGTK